MNERKLNEGEERIGTGEDQNIFPNQPKNNELGTETRSGTDFTRINDSSFGLWKLRFIRFLTIAVVSRVSSQLLAA